MYNLTLIILIGDFNIQNWFAWLFSKNKDKEKTEKPDEFVFRPEDYRIKPEAINVWFEYKNLNFKGTLFTLTNKICNELYTNPIADSSVHLQLKVINDKISFYFFLQSEGLFFSLSLYIKVVSWFGKIEGLDGTGEGQKILIKVWKFWYNDINCLISSREKVAWERGEK